MPLTQFRGVPLTQATGLELAPLGTWLGSVPWASWVSLDSVLSTSRMDSLTAGTGGSGGGGGGVGSFLGSNTWILSGDSSLRATSLAKCCTAAI
jgi:hypothetical protein